MGRRKSENRRGGPFIGAAGEGMDERRRNRFERRPRRASRAPQPASRASSSKTTARCAGVQHFFHQNPTTIPAIILVIAVVAFGAITRGQFLLPAQPLADPHAGDDHRAARHGADPRHRHRRHRPLGRRHHGSVVDRHGQARRRLSACRCRSRSLLGILTGTALRLHQRLPHHPAAAAAVHRDARHLEHLRGAGHAGLGVRDHPQGRPRGEGAVPPRRWAAAFRSATAPTARPPAGRS